MIPIIRAVNDYMKGKRDIVKNLNFRYGEANKYFFGGKKNGTNRRNKI